jgi:disulfide oxidoreductase YuzD
MSFKKDQFESKLVDIFKKPLEDTINEFQEKIK